MTIERIVGRCRKSKNSGYKRIGMALEFANYYGRLNDARAIIEKLSWKKLESLFDAIIEIVGRDHVQDPGGLDNKQSGILTAALRGAFAGIAVVKAKRKAVPS
jgi:hypothetical protein